jgi:hypothetical protein
MHYQQQVISVSTIHLLTLSLHIDIDIFRHSLPDVSPLGPSCFPPVRLILNFSVDRFSPHVIASAFSPRRDDSRLKCSLTDIFFGHTHEDQFSVHHDFFVLFLLANSGQL